MKASVVSKKYKKQFLELDYLYAELDYYEDSLKEAQEEFQESFYEYSKQNNLGYNKPQDSTDSVASTEVSTFVSEQQEEEYNEEQTNYNIPPQEHPVEANADEQDEKDEDLIKLYKKIASITHPDAIPAGEKQELKEKRVQQFMEAQTAHKEKNWYKLCQIAIALGLETPEPKKKHIKWMEDEGVRIRKRIDHIKSTYAWVWYNEEQENRKINLMKHYFQALAVKK